ncbi:transcriptional regulator [Geminocystis sp. GBBB08]|uniref:helix-turn-helix domain-containing transcriptional regulator n=1 Tax=Geminocystis sp. GBBB08 TaxID=2604140 RepID=UPI0027E2367B|nr:transcriptional regulator [Geminocystis sp. GBBB08]MBL1209144.1 transcriptional regulator [Geminocystis sp. GBBB08]
MPTLDYQTDLLKRLSDSEYACQYLKVVLDETLKDGDIEPFLLALKNIIKARKINPMNNSFEGNLDSLISQEINLKNLSSILNQVGLTIYFKPVELEN